MANLRLTITQKIKDQMHEVMRRQGMLEEKELISASLAMYDYLTQKVKDGKTVHLRSEDGTLSDPVQLDPREGS